MHSKRRSAVTLHIGLFMMVRLLIAIWVVGILGSASALAQTDSALPAGASSPADENPLPGPPPPSGVRPSLPGAAAPIGTRIDELEVGDNGETVITPADDVALPFAMPGSTGPQQPAAYVASVEFEGDVIDEFADGRLVTEIIVTRNHGWHVLNLNLNQAICRNWEYEYEGEGSGESNPVISPIRDDGLSWQFRGIGRHRLVLTMRVPVHHASGGHQLQLALPPMPREFETLVKLRFGSSVRVRRPDGETLFSQSNDDAGRTVMTAGISGPRLDLTWEEAQADVAQVAEVKTEWSFRSDDSDQQSRLFATADQLLQPEHGTLDSIEVRLPTGWELLSVTGERYISHEVVPETGLTRVYLRNADSQFHLQWYFRRNFEPPQSELSIDGLMVSGAQRQSGRIAVESPVGWQLGWVPGSSEGVDRSAPATRPGSPASGLTFGYQFQPFRLVLDLRQRQSLAVIRPRWFLNATAERLELQAEFEVDAAGDPVSMLQIVWPEAKDEGWQIEWINEPTQTEIDPEVDVAFRSGSLSLPVPEGSNVIRLRLSRPVGTTGSFDFTLPGVHAPFVEPGWLIQQSADEVVFETVAATESSQLATGPTPGAFDWPVDFSPESASQTPYAVGQGPLHATFSIHTREIEAITTVAIEGLAQQWISISQEFDLQVRYGRLASVKFLIPDSLRQYMQPQASNSAMEFRVNGDPIAYRWPDPADPAVEIDFTRQPLLGAVRIEARYKYPWDQSRGDRLSLPVLALSVAETTTTRCSIPNYDLVPVIVEGQGWSLVPTAPDTQLWEFAGKTLAVPLALAPAQSTQLARQSIATAYCTVVFQNDGGYRVIANYSISPETRMWSCELPSSARGEQFFLGDQPIPTQSATLNGRTSHVLRLTLGRMNRDLLRIEYAVPSPNNVGIWGEAEIELPRVSESIWIEEIFIETILPDGMHLFKSPRGWTQEFDWQRTGFFWTRQPTARLLSAREDYGGSSAGNSRGGSRYGFSRFGATPRLSMAWMSRPLIVLLGAGITLLLGFMLTRFPAFRGPLPILCLGFAISLVGLWYPEPLELLLQPALLGLVLAWGASRLGVARRYGHAESLEPRVDLGSQKPSSITSTGTFPTAAAVASGTQSTIYRPLAHFGQHSSTSAPPK